MDGNHYHSYTQEYCWKFLEAVNYFLFSFFKLKIEFRVWFTRVTVNGKFVSNDNNLLFPKIENQSSTILQIYHSNDRWIWWIFNLIEIDVCTSSNAQTTFRRNDLHFQCYECALFLDTLNSQTPNQSMELEFLYARCEFRVSIFSWKI